MRLRHLAVSAFLLLGCVSTAYRPHTVVLVRHAEKVDHSYDAALSAVGEARAQRLGELLSQLPIDAIFVSEFARTQKTAQPIAERSQVTPTVIPAKDRAILLGRLRALKKNSVALVVGHQDTLPLLLRDLGVLTPVSIDASDYGNLFIVVDEAAGPPTFLRLRF